MSDPDGFRNEFFQIVLEHKILMPLEMFSTHKKQISPCFFSYDYYNYTELQTNLSQKWKCKITNTWWLHEIRYIKEVMCYE